VGVGLDILMLLVAMLLVDQIHPGLLVMEAVVEGQVQGVIPLGAQDTKGLSL
jgi:hypothetical protein